MCYNTLMKPITKIAVIESLLAVAYIALVSGFIYSTPTIFGGGDGRSVLIPIMMLLLFVVSAAITGSLVFGRSVIWYLDGDKSDAVRLAVYKMIVLFTVLVLVVLSMIVMFQN